MKQIFLAFFIALSPTLALAELNTVPYVDLSKYAGTWYQIARNPLIFEKGCVCSKQVLAPEGDGRISVYNSCNNKTVDGPIREIRDYATSADTDTNSKFSVDFNLPFKGSYWISGLDADYRWST